MASKTNPLKTGDVAALKSAPKVKMTIGKITGGVDRCQWFVGMTLYEGYFEIDSLIAVK
jgi:uncharacterized protein YodC (DUF2158 family)